MKKLLLLGYLSIAFLSTHAQVRVEGMRVEFLKDPIGIDIPQPRLSWYLTATGRNVKQLAYELRVAKATSALYSNRSLVWQTGKISSGESLLLTYAGQPLESGRKYYWQVRVWDNKGNVSEWSPAAFWQMGLLKKEDWKGKWIGLDGDTASPPDDHRRLPARMVRHEFQMEKPIAQATAFLSGLGFSELSINGKKVDDRRMDPTHSNYTKRTMYVGFDVTKYLVRGSNALGVLLGNGRFFSPRVKLPVYTPTFGFPKMLLQLEVKYTDGSSALIVSDQSWKITDQGPIRSNSEFDGEEYDARMEQDGWDKPGFNDSKWQPVQLVSAPAGRLIAQKQEPMRVVGKINPVSIAQSGPGKYVVDFGENLYGMCEIKVKGSPGTKIVIRTAFDIDTAGNLNMAPNRSALSTDVYTLKGKGLEIWAPRFRGQGTRYAEITGWPGTLKKEDIALLPVQSDLTKTGEFNCSNELVNKIYANTVRTIRMQERGLPMDPDRDERQAWLSVSEKTSESEGYLYDVAAFYTNFLDETRSSQRGDGLISEAGSLWLWETKDPCWPAVITTTPWSSYYMYGDKRILADNYPAMKRWGLYLEKNTDSDFIYRKGSYSDWVDAYSMDKKTSDNGGTPRELLSTAYLYYDFTTIARTATFLGQEEDATYFTALARKTEKAFRQTFFDPALHAYLSQTQTSFVLPLSFGLVPPEEQQQVTDNLVNDILVKQQGHLTVGCPGLKWLMQLLTSTGHPDVAYTILTQTTRPSWGYMVGKDGTSIWERWDRDTRDPGMNGQSQTILSGYLDAWMYQSLGGIDYDTTQPGFKNSIMHPTPVGDLHWVNASFLSPYGQIRSAWKKENGIFHWQITVPANTTATIYIPAKDAAGIREGGRPVKDIPEITYKGMEKEAAVFTIGSGAYTFTSVLPGADTFRSAGSGDNTFTPTGSDAPTLQAGFRNPPDSVRPGVYWYFMDGNMSAAGMTKDLEAMQKAGIGQVLFLEVNVGVPQGPVDFLGDKWQDLFRHAVRECERLGIRMTLGIGPGWTGSGGPWVAPSESMQHLVSSTLLVSGSDKGKIRLPLPQPKRPYFGEGTLSPQLQKEWQDYYQDVAVLAFPTPAANGEIKNIDEKALYYREPFSSKPGVRPFIPYEARYPDTAIANIPKEHILDLSDKLQPDGSLKWIVPQGHWTIMRFGSRNSGAVTRPAPIQGLGFESDKFDTTALNHHLDAYVGKVIRSTGLPPAGSQGGLKMLHMDSWEMGAQNWSANFRKEFIRRRGYDPLPFYPVYAGKIVGNREVSERFLWDLRQTSQELIISNHAEQVKKYAHRQGLGLSIEPYDMNPTADLELGAVADIPMSEFWSKGYGYNTSFSVIEATSLAHTRGIPVVQAEAFTAEGSEAWRQYPGSMKDQGDWALAAGVNRFFYHTFQHKPFADSLRPGMNMGPYGVHWDRMQTWWPMADAYHRYISRCQFLLQQGRSVADILYLTPEGSPNVFQPPASAMEGDTFIPDRKGYNFDGCSPGQLYLASVVDNRILFPGGASYRLLVLPAVAAMTPALLEKIKSLVEAGATVVGPPPLRSPSLSGYPQCDRQVQDIVQQLWGNTTSTSSVSGSGQDSARGSVSSPGSAVSHIHGKGKIFWGGNLRVPDKESLYPDYRATSDILQKMNVLPDFETSASLRYTHRLTKEGDIYFVSNRIGQPIEATCTFNSSNGAPSLWDPLTGTSRPLGEFSVREGRTTLPMRFDAFQSFFILFQKQAARIPNNSAKNFPSIANLSTLSGPWTVSFDPKWGGPSQVKFDSLSDWSMNADSSIRYYSGIAVYHKRFDFTAASDTDQNNRLYLNLGKVKNMARIWLNGQDLGVAWTAPWKVDITGIVKQKDNQLEISIANLWPNRLIGDDHLPQDGIRDNLFPDWLVKGEKRTSGRYAFTTYDPYTKDSPLLESGLIGPVVIQKETF